MRKLTEFDVLNDRVLFDAAYCTFCDNDFNVEDLVFEVFQGQFGHIVIVGYHTKCLLQRYNMFQSVDGLKIL